MTSAEFTTFLHNAETTAQLVWILAPRLPEPAVADPDSQSPQEQAGTCLTACA